jgi:biopolymer transport protein ExbD
VKIRRRNTRWSEGSVNVTPLIDVVMVMIVFFMLVAKIGVTTGAEAMDLPATILGAKLEDMGNTLTLNVRPGATMEPMVTALVSGAKQELKVGHGNGPLLVDALKHFRFGNDPKDPRQVNPDFKVIIRAEKDMTYRYLEPVLLACAEARVKNVNFTTAKVMEE